MQAPLNPNFVTSLPDLFNLRMHYRVSDLKAQCVFLSAFLSKPNI